MFHVPERYRMSKGPYGSDSYAGNWGMFKIQRTIRTVLYAMASDGLGWEHVSVHCVSEGKERCPTWAEMCFIKDLFWDGDDVAIQYHPRKSEYVNMHPFTLHLWRPVGAELPTPDPLLVGINLNQ